MIWFYSEVGFCVSQSKIGEFSDTSFYDCQIAIQNYVQFYSYFTITRNNTIRWKDQDIYIVYTCICVPQRRTEEKADSYTMLELTELQLLWIITGMTFSPTFSLMKQWKCIVVVEEELRTFLQMMFLLRHLYSIFLLICMKWIEGYVVVFKLSCYLYRLPLKLKLHNKPWLLLYWYAYKL